MTTKREIRTLTAELRAKPESRTIEGYAALFNEEADLGYFRETILPGAFEGANLMDVRVLFNHDPNWIMGRTASGTATLEVDKRGLKYRFDAPNTNAGNDLLEMIRRGDVSQSSFAFTVAEDGDVWEGARGEKQLRKIEKFSALYDVSPVTYPAYTNTSVQARSAEEVYRAHEDDEHPTPDQLPDDETEAGPDEFQKEQDELMQQLMDAAEKIAATA